MGIDKGDMVDMKLFASKAKVDSASILPVRGNIYPDGYGWILLLCLIDVFNYIMSHGKGECFFWE